MKTENNAYDVADAEQARASAEFTRAAQRPYAPGSNICVDADCPQAHQVQTGLGERRPSGQHQAAIVDPEISSGRAADRWRNATKRHREKYPADDAPDIPLAHRDLREGLGFLNRR